MKRVAVILFLAALVLSFSAWAADQQISFDGTWQQDMKLSDAAPRSTRNDGGGGMGGMGGGGGMGGPGIGGGGGMGGPAMGGPGIPMLPQRNPPTRPESADPNLSLLSLI